MAGLAPYRGLRIGANPIAEQQPTDSPRPTGVSAFLDAWSPVSVEPFTSFSAPRSRAIRPSTSNDAKWIYHPVVVSPGRETMDKVSRGPLIDRNGNFYVSDLNGIGFSADARGQHRWAVRFSQPSNIGPDRVDPIPGGLTMSRDGAHLYFTTAAGTICSVATEDGHLEWEQPFSGPSHHAATLAVLPDGSIAGTTAWGELAVFDGEGHERWRSQPLLEGPAIHKAFVSSPCVGPRGDLAFAVDVEPDFAGGTSVLGLLIMYGPNGEERWRIEDAGSWPRTKTSPVIVGGRIFHVEDGQSHLVGRSLDTGAREAGIELSRIPGGLGINHSDRVLYVPSGFGVVAVSDRLEKLWERDLSERFTGTPVYAAGRVYLMQPAMSIAGAFSALDASTGETVWTKPIVANAHAFPLAVTAEGSILAAETSGKSGVVSYG